MYQDGDQVLEVLYEINLVNTSEKDKLLKKNLRRLYLK